jgi:serine/threonine-protein kinase RsbW
VPSHEKERGGALQVKIVLTLPRDTASVPLARHTVAAALRRAGVAADCVAEVEVAISEACTNAYAHATDALTYEVTISLQDEQLTIDVVDAGPGFGRAAPSAAMPHPASDGGRGVALMAAFSDEAVFDSVTGGGGSVHLVKLLRWSDQAQV